MDQASIVLSVRHWVETLVIDLNLCPFAKRELVKNRIRFSVSDAETEESLLAFLTSELQRLTDDDTIETSLVIHPAVLTDFYEYNDFLNLADDLLRQMGLEGVYQIASFHPNYQFGGTAPDDVENYTNRSPYPLLHLIREDSLERAIEGYPNAEAIPDRNIELMHELGKTELSKLLHSCFEHPKSTTPNIEP